MPKTIETANDIMASASLNSSAKTDLNSTALPSSNHQDLRSQQQRQEGNRSEALHARQQLDENNITFGAKILYERNISQNMGQSTGASRIGVGGEQMADREIFARQLVTECSAKKKRRGYKTNSEQLVLQLLKVTDLPESELQQYAEKNQDALKLSGLEPHEFLALAKDLQRLEQSREIELHTGRKEASLIKADLEEAIPPDLENSDDAIAEMPQTIEQVANSIIDLSKPPQKEEMAAIACLSYLSALSSEQISELSSLLKKQEPEISLEETLNQIGGEGLAVFAKAIEDNDIALRDAALMELLLQQDGFDAAIFINHLKSLGPQGLAAAVKSYRENFGSLLERLNANGVEDIKEIERFIETSSKLSELDSSMAAINQEFNRALINNQTALTGVRRNIKNGETTLAGNWNPMSAFGGWQAQHRSIENDRKLEQELLQQRKQLELARQQALSAAGAAQAARQQALTQLWAGNHDDFNTALADISKQQKKLAEIVQKPIRGLPNLSRWHSELKAVNSDFERFVGRCNSTETGLRYAQTGLAIAGGVGVIVVSGGTASPFLAALMVSGAMSGGVAVESYFDFKNGKEGSEIAWNAAGKMGNNFLNAWTGSGIAKIPYFFARPGPHVQLTQNVYDTAGKLMAKKGAIYGVRTSAFQKLSAKVAQDGLKTGADKLPVKFISNKLFSEGGKRTTQEAAKLANKIHTASNVVGPAIKPVTEMVGYARHQLKEKTEPESLHPKVRKDTFQSDRPNAEPTPDPIASTEERAERSLPLTNPPQVEEQQRNETAHNDNNSINHSEIVPDRPPLPQTAAEAVIHPYPDNAAEHSNDRPPPPPPEEPAALLNTEAKPDDRPPPEEPPQEPPFYPGFGFLPDSSSSSSRNENHQTAAPKDSQDAGNPTIVLQPASVESDTQPQFLPHKKELESGNRQSIYFETERPTKKESGYEVELTNFSFSDRATLARENKDTAAVALEHGNQNASLHASGKSSATSLANPQAELLQISRQNLVGRQLAESEQRALAEQISSAKRQQDALQQNLTNSQALHNSHSLQLSQAVHLSQANEITVANKKNAASSNAEGHNQATANVQSEELKVQSQKAESLAMAASQISGHQNVTANSEPQKQSSSLAIDQTARSESSPIRNKNEAQDSWQDQPQVQRREKNRQKKKVIYDLEYSATAALVAPKDKKGKVTDSKAEVGNTQKDLQGGKADSRKVGRIKEQSNATEESKNSHAKSAYIIREKSALKDFPDRLTTRDLAEKGSTKGSDIKRRIDARLEQALIRQALRKQNKRERIAIAVEPLSQQPGKLVDNRHNMALKKKKLQLKRKEQRRMLEQFLFEKQLKERKRKRRVALGNGLVEPLLMEDDESQVKSSNKAAVIPKNPHNSSKAELYRQLTQSAATGIPQENIIPTKIDPVKNMAALYRRLRDANNPDQSEDNEADSKLISKQGQRTTKAELYRKLKQ